MHFSAKFLSPGDTSPFADIQASEVTPAAPQGWLQSIAGRLRAATSSGAQAPPQQAQGGSAENSAATLDPRTAADIGLGPQEVNFRPLPAEEGPLRPTQDPFTVRPLFVLPFAILILLAEPVRPGATAAESMDGEQQNDNRKASRQQLPLVTASGKIEPVLLVHVSPE